MGTASGAGRRRSRRKAKLRQTDEMSVGQELAEERRRRRRAGDPRLAAEDKELLRRLTTGDLVGEFQAGLDAVSCANPLLGGASSDGG